MQKCLLCLIIVLTITICGTETISINNSKNSVRILESSESGLKLEFNFGQFEIDEMKIDGKTYHKLSLKGELATFEKGEPELPFFAKSIMIPEQSGVAVRN